ncbi:MAG TPA: zinc ribbon domain-containing protein [Gemmataceae bacterium]|nr:zinc ribbon domain-containing protein [Gemmataceae bacterium]
MPLYEFVCRECKHSFEALVFGADGETTCPQCESAKVEKQMSAPARTQTEAASLPMGCDPSLPPCGPSCRRFSG